MDMGDLQRSLSPSFSSTSFSSSLDQYPLSIDSEIWLMAEQRTQEILCTIQPAFASEQKRKEIIDYIQRLIKGYYATEVFPFGSAPLKTYLPDGDIDLTVLCYEHMEEDLARDVCSILKCEEQNREFQVKDIQYIQAQVKLVKCSVKNIPVDISFNQISGLSALCFLEQVDQLIGKDHLFKRSIILIKAWCFYESRILGAHHGLIATYALEILVLYIINLFHSSLPGPLAVLHRFLEYYSTFEWDNYCVSIDGPVAISSLPEIVAESVENNGNELLLSPEFLRNCKEAFTGPTKSIENGGHEFPAKHLNIVDPLKDSNNLGRSVSKGNFHRIRCALSHGAQRLGEILMLPGEIMGAELEKFFVNTLDRNGRGERSDAQVPVSVFGTERFDLSDLSGDYDNYYSGLLHSLWYHNYAPTVHPQPDPPSLPCQIQQTSARDALSWQLKCKQNVFTPQGPDVFVRGVPIYHPYISQLYAANSGIDESGKSRGTGTYIPDMSHHPYRDLHSWIKARNPAAKSYRKINQVEESLKTEKSGDGSCHDFSPSQFTPETGKHGNDSCLDLSLDQFPLLPCIKKSTSSEIHCSPQPIVKSPEAKDCSAPLEPEKSGNGSCLDFSLDQFPLLPCTKKSTSSEIHQSAITKSLQIKDYSPHLERIKFGTFGCKTSPLGLPSSVASKQESSGASTTVETTPVVPKRVLRQQYQLQDDEEFPPLCL